MTDSRIATRELTEDEIEDRLLAALRQREGQVTEADLVVATGIEPHQISPGLRRLAIEYRCQMAVKSDGQILYRFDPRLIRRLARPWARTKAAARAAWASFTLAFKVLTGLVLFFYVGVFVLILLVLTEFGAVSFDGEMLKNLAKPHRVRRAWAFLRAVAAATVRRCQKVFAFIFGPPTEKRDEFSDQRELLAFVRARAGIVTPAEIIAQTGWPSETADQESTLLVARYGGDVEVEDGQMLFTFSELAPTADTHQDAACPPPCWERLETPVDITGNSTFTDLAVVGVNVFVLLAALVLVPWVLAPQLQRGLETPGLMWGLMVVPASYVIGAFLIHGIRRLFVAELENERRLQRNLRRLLLREAFHARDINSAAVVREVAAFPVRATAQKVQRMAEAMAIELMASIEPGDDGRIHFRWNRLAESLAAAEARRARVPAPRPTDVVFTT